MTEYADAFMPARAACMQGASQAARRLTPERLASPHEYAVEGAERFSTDARLSLTVSFLYSKEKKYAIHSRGKPGGVFRLRKNSKKILTSTKWRPITCPYNQIAASQPVWFLFFPSSMTSVSARQNPPTQKSKTSSV
jgi:hypothetical protein